MERTPRISVPEDGGCPIRTLAIILAAAGLLLAATNARGALRPDVVAFWHRVHSCEQPSTWFHPGPTYPGGLGIYAPNWRWWAGELGLLRRYPRANYAPVPVQIRVADYGYRRHRGYWACFRHTGFPPR